MDIEDNNTDSSSAMEQEDGATDDGQESAPRIDHNSDDKERSPAATVAENNEYDSFGKRKADDFLRRHEQNMDTQFKPFVVLPGDDLTEPTTRATRTLRLGAGLIQHGDRVSATRAGMLRYRPPRTFWVETNGRRYYARVEDQVIGIIEDRAGDFYKVSIFGSSPAMLDLLAFDGASKRSKPNLKTGSLIFCRVLAADKDMDTELTCTSTHHGSKKDWMTGQSTFGELKGGKMQRCSLMLAKSLTKPDCRVLSSLAKHIPFEIAAGLNGAFWVDSGSYSHTIVICNAILNSENMTDAQTDAMVDRLVNLVKKDR